MSVECTREWGDGWEVLEPYFNNDDLEDSYREMMDWIAGGGEVHWTNRQTTAEK